MIRFSPLLLFSLFLAGCSQFNVQTGSTREADERAIRDLDAEWAKAAAAKNLDQVMMSNPGYALSFSPSCVDVAKAGDMAYEFGVYNLMLTGPDRKPINDRGK